MGYNRGRKQTKAVLERLADRVDESVLEGEVVHVSVDCSGDDVSTDAAIAFWEELTERLTVLAAEPRAEAIQDGSVEEGFDVLALTDVPSPLVAARLMRIGVGKELQPMSTVSFETPAGTTVTARCWAVDIVDDGSEPGWDHPAQKLAAVRREEANSTADGAPAAEASEEGEEVEQPTSGSAPTDSSGATAAPRSSTAGSTDSTDTKLVPTSGDARGTAESQPFEEAEASSERVAPTQPVASQSATEPTERGDDSPTSLLEEPRPEEPDAVAIEGAEPDSDSLAVRLHHLQSKVQSMEVYASVIESFVDAHGTPRRAFDVLSGDLRDIRSEVSAVESTVADLEERQADRMEVLADRLHEHGQRLDRHSSRIDEEAGRIEANADRLEDQADRLADVDDRLDEQAHRRARQATRLDDHADRLDGQAEQLDDQTDRVDRLEDVLTTLFSLQRAQWKECRDRLEEVRSVQAERVDALEHRIDERNREFRRLLAGWITDAELELFEIDERVRTNESWREQVSAATAWEPKEG